MRRGFHKKFNEQFNKLPIKQRKAVEKTVTLFFEDPNHPRLRNHPLKGRWVNYRSISAGGDLRLHYQVINEEKVLFVAVGSHSQLYK